MQEVTPRPIDVAVGILMRPNGDVLLGQRPAGTHQPFPAAAAGIGC